MAGRGQSLGAPPVACRRLSALEDLGSGGGAGSVFVTCGGVGASEESVFGQVFSLADVPVVGLLVLLEGVMSIDNALVLGLLASRVRPELQRKALTYGLVGAFLFRGTAISVAAFLLTWHIVKLLGGGYLLWVAGKHFSEKAMEGAGGGAEGAAAGGGVSGEEVVAAGAVAAAGTAAFWPTVVMIEFTDIAFAVDSIVAAIGVVGPPPVVNGEAVSPHPKLWVVIAGGIIGLVLMRFAAALFIKLLARFPRFETAAYLLVCVIGLKLVVDYGANDLLKLGGGHAVDFHSPASPWFWGFWGAMAVCFLFGFWGGRKGEAGPAALAGDLRAGELGAGQ